MCAYHSLQLHPVNDSSFDSAIIYVLVTRCVYTYTRASQEHEVNVVCVAQGMGSRHPDSMVLANGLTPLLLAADVPVRTEEHDRRMKRIMRTLLLRGAHITQRETLSGTGLTAMHFLASQPRHNNVTHRIRFLVTALDEYRNGGGDVPALPGLNYDPVLNGAPVAGGSGDVVSISVHLLGMRCYQGQLPEELAPAGDRRRMLQQARRRLPPGLQDSGFSENNTDFN